MSESTACVCLIHLETIENLFLACAEFWKNS